MRILVLFAHPAFHKSKVNKLLVQGIEEHEQVTFHDLYEEYPEFDIDVTREQQLLVEHDVIIFQFPLYWYSTPAMIKEWQDMVLEHGWAFGSKGNALQNKLFTCLVTVGGLRDAYQKDGFYNHTLPDLLAPLKQTATLCKMIPLPPFAVHGTHAIEAEEVERHKVDLLKLLKELADGTFECDQATKCEYLNDYITKQG